MRIWQIAFFIFVLQLMINVGGTLDLGFATPGMKVPELFNSTTISAQENLINSTQVSSKPGVLESALGFLQTISYIIGGIATMIGMLAGAVINTESFINLLFGGALPYGFTAFITLLVRVLYIVGMIQLFLGRSLKQDD